MDAESGKIIHCSDGEELPAGHVEITQVEAKILEKFKQPERVAELIWMRTRDGIPVNEWPSARNFILMGIYGHMDFLKYKESLEKKNG